MAVDVASLYQRFGPMVLRRCRALLRDEELAVDAMQDVFVNILRRHPELRADAPSSLLFRTATHVCLNRLREARRKPTDQDEALLLEIAALDDLEGRTAASALLDTLFQREVESTRTLAVLHLVDGMTLEETAREVGLSVSGVRKRLRTLRARLTTLIDAEAA